MWISKDAVLVRGRRLFEAKRLLEEIRYIISTDAILRGNIFLCCHSYQFGKSSLQPLTKHSHPSIEYSPPPHLPPLLKIVHLAIQYIGEILIMRHQRYNDESWNKLFEENAS